MNLTLIDLKKFKEEERNFVHNHIIDPSIRLPNSEEPYLFFMFTGYRQLGTLYTLTNGSHEKTPKRTVSNS